MWNYLRREGYKPILWTQLSETLFFPNQKEKLFCIWKVTDNLKYRVQWCKAIRWKVYLQYFLFNLVGAPAFCNRSHFKWIESDFLPPWGSILNQGRNTKYYWKWEISIRSRSTKLFLLSLISHKSYCNCKTNIMQSEFWRCN